jgi:hypothetical protein
LDARFPPKAVGRFQYLSAMDADSPKVAMVRKLRIRKNIGPKISLR